MNIQIEDVNTTRKNITVSLTADEIAAEEKAILQQFALQAKLPGFRPGKAPVAMIRKRYAKEIRDEVNRKVVTAAYQELGKDKTINLYGVVDIEGAEVALDSEANIKFIVDLQPEFELPEYKGVTIHKYPEIIDESKVDEVIDRIRTQRAEYNKVERAVVKTDYVKISYEGKLDGQLIAELAPDAKMYGTQEVTWEEAGAENSPGIQSVIQGVMGMNVGDKKTVEETFPADFEVEALAGKTATYDVEVLEVRECVLPEIDEKFLESLNVKTIEEFRDSVKERLLSQKTQENQDHMRKQLINALTDKVDFQLPASAVESHTQRLVAEHMQHYMEKGVTQEQFEENKETLLASAEKAASRDIKTRFLLAKIADAEGIKVEEKDLQERFLQEAYMTRTKPEQLMKELRKDRARVDEMRRACLLNKTLEFLLGTAIINESEHYDDPHAHTHDHGHDHEKCDDENCDHKH